MRRSAAAAKLTLESAPDSSCQPVLCSATGNSVSLDRDGPSRGVLTGKFVRLCELCRARHKSHYADYPVMPRRPSVSDEDSVSYAA